MPATVCGRLQLQLEAGKSQTHVLSHTQPTHTAGLAVTKPLVQLLTLLLAAQMFGIQWISGTGISGFSVKPVLLNLALGVRGSTV